VDGFGGKSKPLWSHQSVKLDQRVVDLGLCLPLPGAAAPAVLPGSEAVPLVVTADCVCFLAGHKLLAVDPLSGQVLWMRDDVRPMSDLFGDEDFLLVTPPESSEAVVLSVHDGRELGRRRVPDWKQRLWTHGRRALTWQVDAGKARLALVDPWTEQTIWRRDFDAKARPWMIESDEVAVFEPQGRLVTLALPSGQNVFSAQVEPMTTVEEIAVLRSSRHYVLVVSVASDSVPAGGPSMPGSILVNGRVYGFDRRTAAKLWSIEVADQGLRPDQPADLPVLTFLTTGQKMVGDDSRSYSQLLCVDKRTGRTLHRKEIDDNCSVLYEIRSDPGKGRVELRTALGTVKFTFTGETEAAKRK
jgi:hypothetical protein